LLLLLLPFWPPLCSCTRCHTSPSRCRPAHRPDPGLVLLLATTLAPRYSSHSLRYHRGQCKSPLSSSTPTQSVASRGQDIRETQPGPCFWPRPSRKAARRRIREAAKNTVVYRSQGPRLQGTPRGTHSLNLETRLLSYLLLCAVTNPCLGSSVLAVCSLASSVDLLFPV
jgi:hypothetical protein